MVRKILKLIVLILIIVGIGFGISITVKRKIPEINSKEAEKKIFSMIQTRPVNATSFYTYGKAFNIEGTITNINEDNFENIKLVITDGIDYEKEYALNYSFKENNLNFSTDKEINSGLVIDELEEKYYYVLIRLKLNNSVEPKYYSFSNKSEFEDITYYTVTKDNVNRKAKISFTTQKYNGKEYNLLIISLEKSQLPEEVYDIVIDAGHGGKDPGENAGSITEADVTLEYSKLLKEALESNGYKVKLTRDDSNSSTFTATNMYDEDGRISIACKTKAKLMISFHINQGVKNLQGFEVYCPCKSNLNFASQMANKIKEYSSINYSNNNSFKMAEGVYVRNFTKSVIKDFTDTANRKGYEPYPITKDTPFLYTIREVGGLATGAYVDGRNKDYSKNEYYNSNQGIECYQIELGYIKNDLDIIINEKENYIRAIQEVILNNY